MNFHPKDQFNAQSQASLLPDLGKAVPFPGSSMREISAFLDPKGTGNNQVATPPCTELSLEQVLSQCKRDNTILCRPGVKTSESEGERPHMVAVRVSLPFLVPVGQRASLY